MAVPDTTEHYRVSPFGNHPLCDRRSEGYLVHLGGCLNVKPSATSYGLRTLCTMRWLGRFSTLQSLSYPPVRLHPWFRTMLPATALTAGVHVIVFVSIPSLGPAAIRLPSTLPSQILPLGLSGRTSEALWSQFANRPPFPVDPEWNPQAISGRAPLFGVFRGGVLQTFSHFAWLPLPAQTFFRSKGSIIPDELSKPNHSLSIDFP